ncbi:MAG: hypothetical protein A2087_02040 [Spirochaetes bacterium GWD1_61_31]|nr:MAG: hypothetical protein A2Y37_11770 [Spirochaetes bacterium GWB1_60_80]OHD29944.1 MAG: hypothetical protein A2004_12010 [Spirochaetes bacterium GWC1_61_12]OHD43802.1 MAG: hypothetical protein A2087_02040 [Spirochaetes bacterium GWD1_61_31]OHD46044.1 MAG: hypothetical protein A2Y35_13595 [Spirochaetes bacterium GWE1_60_18]OHD60616.1 MAG: hypothetical protein A2Y32_08085 [Spirochaetes bacterium GWF1_60_12]HAP43455.1 hypothetical protein [Spirochaetaceae bacterium]
MNPKPLSRKAHRRPFIDACRGFCVLGMILFHALYILRMHNLVAVDLWNVFWWWFARLFAAAFVGLSGWSLAAKRASLTAAADAAATVPGAATPSTSLVLWRTPLRRALKLGLLAAAISLVTRLLFGPTSFVFFGVLHLLCLSGLLGWPLAARPRLAAVVGALTLAAGLLLGKQHFNGLALAWLGFRPAGHQPMDYLPLLPWFAWTAFGSVAFHLGRRFAPRPAAVAAAVPAAAAAAATTAATARPAPAIPSRRIPAPAAGLVWLGRHSLAVYLTHVPLLYGLAQLLVRLR